MTGTKNLSRSSATKPPSRERAIPLRKDAKQTKKKHFHLFLSAKVLPLATYVPSAHGVDVP